MKLMFGLSDPTTRPKSVRVRQAIRLPYMAALVGALLLWTAIAGSAQERPAEPAAPPASNPAEYVGSQTCQMCHEDIFNAFQKNPHQLVETDKKRGWATKACESCHGPGSKHAESMSATDVMNPAKAQPARTDRICLTCHLNQPTHVGRMNSSNAKNQVSCTV